MYSQSDLNSAVKAGAITAAAADALRRHVADQRGAMPADAEHFRLITGFNDIFVSIGVVIMLFAAGAIGEAMIPSLMGPSPLIGLLVAGTAWGLAEVFTRSRRMALPSIILLLAFLGGTALMFVGSFVLLFVDSEPTRWVAGLAIAVTGILTALAAWLHWRRFMVPITIAGGTAAVAATVIGLLMVALVPENSDGQTTLLSLVFVAGLVVFGLAMRWDMSDTARATRRSDVAFWLHLLAAPMLAHPLFTLIGVTEGDAIGIGGALAVLAIYLFFALVALAIDRRALLVSALAYVLVALTTLFNTFGVIELNVALTALVIGSALLTLSAFWTPIRAKVVDMLPGDMTMRLPATA
ncbi:hypothetical protein VCJ71_06160 [Alteriqipengyuania sp. WL0013]|uniref:hypothetical protein n=1 Tax=Alteriqipengyuania sp. WL0013 TaxID=3110773 RepID=UPI002C6F5380|nr:hypothetical protein [Alteriqipengyuania sp. WL0013]MEB3415645.1 hypothetical protein [Alteriqipengyuania sp. WL0013]